MNSFLDTQLLVDASILDEVAIGYSPMIDDARRIVATRLTVMPLRSDGDIDAVQLIDALRDVRIAETAKISLNAGSDGLMRELPGCRPDLNLMIEVPAALAADADCAQGWRELHDRGHTLLLHDGGEIPAGLSDCFDFLIEKFDPLADTPFGRHRPPGPIARVCSGIASTGDLELSFRGGARAAFGWPLDASPHPAGLNKTRHDRDVILELIDRVGSEAPIDRLEETLRRDPTLAFHLLRYMNSATFGLRTAIISIRQSLMMLGYGNLRRWLGLLMITAATPVQTCPLKFAAVRRGLLMAELVRFSDDPELSGELFVCGAFSLLDRMLGEEFVELFKMVPVSAEVSAALLDGSGPYMPFLALAYALESESMTEILRCAEELSIGIHEVNRATLRALRTASEV